MFDFTGQQVMRAKSSKHSREYGQIVCLFCNFLNLFAKYLCPLCVCCMCIVIYMYVYLYSCGTHLEA